MKLQKYTSSYKAYYSFIGIKGCSEYLGVMREDDDNVVLVKCTFGNNSVSFNADYTSYIAAIGY